MEEGKIWKLVQNVGVKTQLVIFSKCIPVHILSLFGSRQFITKILFFGGWCRHSCGCTKIFKPHNKTGVSSTGDYTYVAYIYMDGIKIQRDPDIHVELNNGFVLGKIEIKLSFRVEVGDHEGHMVIIIFIY